VRFVQNFPELSRNYTVQNLKKYCPEKFNKKYCPENNQKIIVQKKSLSKN
jgi:hypothetical protein